MKVPRKYEGRKVLQGCEVPQWFVDEIAKPMNKMMKEVGVKARLKDLTDKEVDVLHDELKNEVTIVVGKLVADYYEQLKKCAWSKLRFLYPDIRTAECLTYDMDKGMIYELEPKEGEGSEAMLELIKKMMP